MTDPKALEELDLASRAIGRARALLAREDLVAAVPSPAVRDVTLREALRQTRNELYWCAEQLKARGLPGVPGDSVDRALAISAELLSLSPPEGGKP